MPPQSLYHQAISRAILAVSWLEVLNRGVRRLM